MSDGETNIAELEQRFDCGHRIIDWDDSYGHCVACNFILAANTCEDERHVERIAELEQQLEEWRVLHE